MWYKQITKEIEVSVRPMYRHKDSSPKDNLYVWSYDVKIENLSDHTVQLLNRHWQITDATGQIQRVQGPGVIGERPVIEPSLSFEYSSFTHLTTATGSMRGQYEMTTSEGDSFFVDIPNFALQMPVRLVSEQNTAHINEAGSPAPQPV